MRPNENRGSDGRLTPAPPRHGRRKPDIAAPSSSIVSTLSANTTPSPSIALIVADEWVGSAVTFGPYVARIPARNLAWALARTVAKPLDGVVEAGPHVVRWDAGAADGSRLGRGVYLVLFRGGGIEAHDKLMILD